MNILQAGESIEDGLELFTECLLGVLDLTGVETCRGKKNRISDTVFIDNPDHTFFGLSPTPSQKLIGSTENE
jgi:hypothetical protein